MRIVGDHLAGVAAGKGDVNEFDLFSRSAFNRYYYSAFLSVRSVLKTIDPAWATPSHQSMPEVLKGEVLTRLKRHIRNAKKSGQISETRGNELFHTAGTAASELSNLLTSARETRRLADYEPETRVWATQRLREYIVKGFTMDDERLKQRGGGNYFEELLARIRDIRSSEKVFWRKVLEIYATSIDYDPGTEASQQFFATVQNKMHWAAHGQTAAEVVHARADAAKPQMGMTNWVGAKPSKVEAVIAKNYLTPEELNALNRIVTVYLEAAELAALNRKPMYMRDWIAKLDDFLRLSGRDILKHAGKIP